MNIKRIINHISKLKYLILIIFIISFSYNCFAYSIDEFLIDILSLYQNNLSNFERDIILSRINLYIEIIKSNNEKLVELNQRISSFPKNRRILIYKVLKKNLPIDILKKLFGNFNVNDEHNLNTEIVDKTKSISIVDPKFTINMVEIKEKEKINTQNNSSNKQNSEKQNNESQNKNNNTNTQKEQNQKQEKSEELKPNDFSIDGVKPPQLPEVFNKYSVNELENFYKEAIKLYYSSDLDKSFTNFWICLINQYNIENCMYYLAIIYEKKSDFNSSIIFYKNTINLYLAKANIDPKFISYLYKRVGIIYNQKKSFEEAILYLKKSIEYSPSDGEVYFQIGFAYYNLQNYDKAKEYFQKSYQLGYQKSLDYLKKLG